LLNLVSPHRTRNILYIPTSRAAMPSNRLSAVFLPRPDPPP
jgi:hypothetical protein